MKVWGRDSPDNPEKPHACTIGRKFWFSDSRGCTIASVVGRKKKRVEERLSKCGVLTSHEEINGVVVF